MNIRTLLPTSASLLLASLFALTFATDLPAQHPRMVLVEEGTNASCPPCAAQNPTFEHFLQERHVQDRVVPVIWHARFPGSDVMNAANPTIHNARITYNAVTGVPGAIVNGRTPSASSAAFYAGAPADTLALIGAIDAVPPTSPILITIDQSRNGGTLSFEVNITTEEQIGLMKLYVAVVEGYHYYANAGTNGEKEFRWIARDMLPSEAGRAVNITPGNNIVISEEYTIPPTLNADQIYVVAWLQNDATKEVLQVGTSRNTISGEADGPLAAVGSGEMPGAWEMNLEPELTGDYHIRLLKELPTGWEASAQIGDLTVTDSAIAPLSSTSQNNLTLSISPSSVEDLRGYGVVTVIIEGERGAHFQKSFRLYSDEIEAIVLLRDEGRPETPDYYDRALRAGEHVYALIHREDEDLFSWTDHVVIMEVGKWALEVADVAAIREAFDRGGTRLYLIGAEIGFGLADPENTDPRTPRDVSFMRDYLHATYASDDNPSGLVRGFQGDPIGDGLTLTITTGVQNQDTPDELRTVGDAIPSFYYGTDQSAIAGLRYADEENRLVYLGFGAEGIGNEETRQLLLTRGITWLLSSETTGVDDDRSTGSLLHLAAGPNPSDRDITLTFGGADGPYTIDLYDMRGVSMIETIHGQTTTADQTLRLNVESVPNGMYRLVVKVGDEVRGVPVMVVR